MWQKLRRSRQVWSCIAATCSAHLVLAPADPGSPTRTLARWGGVAWKSCALRIGFCDPRWKSQPSAAVTLRPSTSLRACRARSRHGRALRLRVSRESEVAANETRAARRRGCLYARHRAQLKPLTKYCRGRVGDATEDDSAASPKRGGAHQGAPFDTRQRRNCCRYLLDLLFERLARAAG